MDEKVKRRLGLIIPFGTILLAFFLPLISCKWGQNLPSDPIFLVYDGEDLDSAGDYVQSGFFTREGLDRETGLLLSFILPLALVSYSTIYLFLKDSVSTISCRWDEKMRKNGKNRVTVCPAESYQKLQG